MFVHSWPLISFLFLLLFTGGVNAADDPVVAVQRGLKARGFYSGALDGRINDETRAGLKRFQIRAGLAVTGETDVATLQALAASPPGDSQEKSKHNGAPSATESMRERSRNLEKDDREFLSRFVEAEKRGEAEPSKRPLAVETLPPSFSQGPGAVAESAPPAAIRREPDAASNSEIEVRRYVESYLKAAEAPEPDEEVSFYADRVDYFDSGRVTREFIRKDQQHYYRRWPSRNFTLVGMPQVEWMDDERATVRFRIRYKLSGERERTSGATENLVQLRRTVDGLKIAGIRERKIRE